MWILAGITAIILIESIQAVTIGSGVTMTAKTSNSKVQFNGGIYYLENATIETSSVTIYNFICTAGGESQTLIYNTANGTVNIESYCATASQEGARRTLGVNKLGGILAVFWAIILLGAIGMFWRNKMSITTLIKCIKWILIGAIGTGIIYMIIG